MKKVIGTTLIVIGIAFAIFVRLGIGVFIAFIDVLVVSPKLLSKLAEKRK
jgi:hypothetical protein